MSQRKVLFLAGLAAMVLLAAFGCSLLVRDDSAEPAGSGWYIKLRIQAPAAAKGITVSELDVTGLQILVRDSSDVVLQTIDWAVGQGGKDYVVPVKQLGEHEIEVTHYGLRQGQPVQVTESATFTIRAMKITVIDIVPGCIGVIDVGGEEPPEPVDLTGYWDAILTPEGGTPSPPHLLYFKQTGSSLNCSDGIIGTVSGMDVTLVVTDFEATVVGTLGADGRILGTMERWGQTLAVELRRSVLDFGTFALSGIVSLDTDRGLATETDWGECQIDYMDEDLNVGLNMCPWFGPFTTGTFLVPDQIGVAVYRRFDDGSGFAADAVSGTLVITGYEEGVGIEGHFENLLFPEGALTGSFDVSFALNGYN